MWEPYPGLFFMTDEMCSPQISSELQGPCSSALFWMSAPGSEQVSSNTPFTCFSEPVKTNCRLKRLNKKCSGVETLESRKFTVSGDMTVHDE